MSYGQYEILPEYYDALNSSADYEAYARFFKEAVARYGSYGPKIVLDAACGTGELTCILAEDFDMIGVDLSEGMLELAAKKARKAGRDVLFLNQDLTQLDLFGTVDAAVCSLDSLNYLTSYRTLCGALSKIAFFMMDGGIFVFDVNTLYRFECVYADNAYVFDEDGLFCSWQNYYDEKKKICDFYLSFFKENADGTYTRSDEIQREKYHSDRTLRRALAEAGFEVIDVFSSTEFGKNFENAEKAYYVCRVHNHNKG